MTDKKPEAIDAELVEETSMTTQSGNFSPMPILQKALQGEATVEQMERLYALQLQYETNEAKKAFFKAFAAFKAETIEIVKNKTVGFDTNAGRTEYDHATIANVINTVTPYLSKHGLALNWNTTQEGVNITVTCTLTHELGFEKSTSMTAGKDDSGKKNAIQQVASTVTYLQRYTALAITGLATKDQDDDGKGSDAEDVEVIDEEQLSRLVDMIDQVNGVTEENFCSRYRISGLPMLASAIFDDAMNTLEKKRSSQ